MKRMYLLIIMYAIIVLNVPWIRDGMIKNIQIYKPKVQAEIIGWGDKYTLALRSIIDDLRTVPQTIIDGKLVDSITQADIDTEETWLLTHESSITADQFDKILRDYNSPAVGLGATVTQYAKHKHIDNAYVLYMFIHESTAGTATTWAGMKPNGKTTHNTGNIMCYGNHTCYNGFVEYASWEEGFKDHIDLLVTYRDVSGDKTIIEALQRWAPATENDQRLNCEQQEEGNLSYPCGLMLRVSDWRKANANVVTIQKTMNVTPGKKHVVANDMHINANYDTVNCSYWGFQAGCQHFGTDIRLAAGESVYAPFDCTYIMTGHYYEAALRGNYVMCTTDDGYEVYSGHLEKAIRLRPGDRILAGTVIGYGDATMLHTHMQMRNPQGELTDFMRYYNAK